MDSKTLLKVQAAVIKRFQAFNAKRDPRANALLFAAIILLGGFMMYNFIGQELTQVASQSQYRAVATPKPTQVVSPTPSSFPTTGVTE